MTRDADDGLGQPNPSPKSEIIRRGQEALERRRRGFEDWMEIAEALQIGRAESMQEVGTNKPTGKRYERVMGEWLVAHSFHGIDKTTRNRALECLNHRGEIEKWRATLKTDAERLRLNSPDANLRRWKAKTDARDPNAPGKTSPFTKLKAAHVALLEKLYRAEREIARGGGDLWDKDDRAEDIADIMLIKLTANKAENVARSILTKLKERKKAQDAAASAEERKALYADESRS